MSKVFAARQLGQTVLAAFGAHHTHDPIGFLLEAFLPREREEHEITNTLKRSRGAITTHDIDDAGNGAPEKGEPRKFATKKGEKKREPKRARTKFSNH